ncbi:MAG: ParE family toxin-like protein [Serratia proteamaculans]
MRARLSGPPADPGIYRKAAALLARFDRGEKVYTHLTQSGKWKINIGYQWRMLSKDKGRNWRLMTHEKYNRLKGRRKKR